MMCAVRADDVLGDGYTTTTVSLRPDDEGEVVATLVRRASDRPRRRAVLYVHGFVDYFFQTHLADAWDAEGWDFYALDLRKYGRSLRSHQTPNYTADLTEYFEELDAAARIIRDDDEHDTLVVLGHSTGGLVTSLWAHARRGSGLIDGLALNSPWFGINEPWLSRTVGIRAVERLGRVRPRVPVSSLAPHYGRSLHRDHDGHWDYDVAWKPIGGFGVFAGFVGAIHRGQVQLAKGLDIDCPVLVCASTRSGPARRWSPALRNADCVLNVDHMAERAPKLGDLVTIARIRDGIHDLALSEEPARSQFFDELFRWTNAYVPAPT
jgi:alpha-beta hydrolase superfamily lysophospholipase